MPHHIKIPGKIFLSEYGERIVFSQGPVNPRDKLGKIGINFHNNFTAPSHQTITASILIQDSDGSENLRTFHLNRKSLLEYLTACNPKTTANSNSTDAQLIKKLNIALKKQTQNTDGLQLRHAGEYRHHSIQKTSWGNTLGKFYSWLYQRTIKSLSSLKARFIFANKEKEYLNISTLLAKKRFHEAAKAVPAYKKHIQNQAINAFGDIPITSKENYVQKNKNHDWDLHINGKYPKKSKVDTSTGTTGKPSVWLRGDEEVSTVINSLKVAAEIEHAGRKVVYIDAFALGPWATGMTAYEVMRQTGTVFASGADKEKILDQLELTYKYERHCRLIAVKDLIKRISKLSNKKTEINLLVKEMLNKLLDNKDLTLEKCFEATNNDLEFKKYKSDIIALVTKLNSEKSQMVIAGYPPFLKDLVDTANAQGIDFTKYHARGIVGGQAISEALRDKLIESGFSHINSSYGASDLDINIGVETDFEIQLRKKIETNPALAEDLFGKNKGLPMVFHYDPFNYHIETTDENELIYTCNRSDRSSPRIRYQLGDQGRVYASSDIQALLIKHGIYDLKPKINLPLLFVWGRDSAVGYRGSKVSFTDLERSITNIDTDNHCVKRAFYKYEEDGNEKFEIWIELGDGIKIPDKLFSKQFLIDMLVNMGKLNQDFLSHLQIDDGAELPILRFFTKGNSPISDPSGHRKQVMVFTDKNLPKDYQHPLETEKCKLVKVNKDKTFMSALNNTPLELKKKVRSKSKGDDDQTPVLVEKLISHGASSPRFMKSSSKTTNLSSPTNESAKKISL